MTSGEWGRVGFNVKHLHLALDSMLYLSMLLSNSVYNWYTNILDTDITRDALSLTLTFIQGHSRLSLFVFSFGFYAISDNVF